MEPAVLLDEQGGLGLLYLAQYLLQRFGGQVRVEASEHFAEPFGHQRLVVADAFGRRTIRGNVRPVQHGVTEPGEPSESGVLDVAFREFHATASTACSASRRRISPDMSFGRRRSRVWASEAFSPLKLKQTRLHH